MIAFLPENLSKHKQIAHEMLSQMKLNDATTLVNKFINIEEIFSSSNDPIIEIINFIETFIVEINTLNNLTLTVIDAYKLMQEQVRVLELPPKAKNIIMDIFNAVELGSHQNLAEKQHFVETFEQNGSNIQLFEYFFSYEPKKHKPKNKDKQIFIPIVSQASQSIEGTQEF